MEDLPKGGTASLRRASPAGSGWEGEPFGSGVRDWAPFRASGACLRVAEGRGGGTTFDCGKGGGNLKVFLLNVKRLEGFFFLFLSSPVPSYPHLCH